MGRAVVDGHAENTLESFLAAVAAADRELAVWCPSERRAKVLAAAGADALVVDNVARHARAVS